MSCNAKKIPLTKINSLLKILKSRKYVVYNQPYQLNIIGVRNTNTQPDKFDDYIYIIYKDDRFKWIGYRFEATTDPSTKYLENLYNSKGTAILPQGQYVDSWKLGYHRGKYKALVQNKSICVYRDYDRSKNLTFDVESKSCGLFGINIHRAKTGGADDGQGNTEFIGDYSAGCQVFANYYCYNDFIQLAEQHKSLYGNSFTYTLIDKSLQRKFIIKRAFYTASILVGLFFVYKGVRQLTK